jgi:hypothetical protein
MLVTNSDKVDGHLGSTAVVASSTYSPTRGTFLTDSACYTNKGISSGRSTYACHISEECLHILMARIKLT